jgi:hypothetical protein
MYVDDQTQQALIQERIQELRQFHRDLDLAIDELQSGNYADPLGLRRLKKQKLRLKDELERLESLLIPDLDA